MNMWEGASGKLVTASYRECRRDGRGGREGGCGHGTRVVVSRGFEPVGWCGRLGGHARDGSPSGRGEVATAGRET